MKQQFKSMRVIPTILSISIARCTDSVAVTCFVTPVRSRHGGERAILKKLFDKIVVYFIAQSNINHIRFIQ